MGFWPSSTDFCIGEISMNLRAIMIVSAKKIQGKPGIFIFFLKCHTSTSIHVSLPQGEQPICRFAFWRIHQAMSTKLHICTQRVMGTTSVAAPRLLSLTFDPFLTTCHRVQSGCSPFETCWSSQSTPLKAISQVVLPGNLWLWTDHASWATWKPVRGAFSGPSQGRLPRAPPKVQAYLPAGFVGLKLDPIQAGSSQDCL